MVVGTNELINYANETNQIVPVRLGSPSFDGEKFRVAFATASGPNHAAGPNYAVEFNNDLSLSNWNTLTNLAGDGTVKTATDAVTNAATRVYRLRVP